MRCLRLLTFTSLAVLSSCAPPDSALRVNVTVRTVGTARVRADCLRLTISNEKQELKSLTIKRPTRDSAVFGVRRGTDLPGTVKVQATGLFGSNCSDETTLKLNALGEVVTGVFPESGVTELAVFLDPPNAALDGDRDGFVDSRKGGPDCNDADKTIFPGAGQVCAIYDDTDCDGQKGCDDTECVSAAACLDPPDRVRVTTSVATMKRYDCAGPFRVELRNATGVRKAIRDTVVALTTSLPGTSVHATGSCAAPVASLPIAYDTSYFDVYLKADGQAFGTTTLTATAAQVATPGSVMVEVHPRPIVNLEFTSMPLTVTAGQCSLEPLTLEFRDSNSLRTDVDAPTTLTMTSAPGDISGANIFFSDALCTNPAMTQQLMAGQGTFSFHVLASRAGTVTITATPSTTGVTAKTQLLQVKPSTARKLAFTNPLIALNTTQSCSMSMFMLELEDQFGNAVTPAADLAVRVTVNGLQNVSLFEATTNCAGAPQTDFVIPARAPSVLLMRARGMTATPNTGDIRATVLNGAVITDATQVVAISAGFASKFGMSGLAQTPVANACSPNPLSVELYDAANNPAISAADVSVTLTTSPAADATFRFYRTAGCSNDIGGVLVLPAGQTSANFYFRGNKAFGPFEIRGNSPTLSAPPSFLQMNYVKPGLPGKLLFTAPATQMTQAGTCTPLPYVANVLDLFDNPTSFLTAQTVTVTSTPVIAGGVTIGTGPCLGTSVPLAAMTPTVSFAAQHTVTTPITPYSLIASVGGLSTPMPVTLTVAPGPSTLAFDTPSSTVSLTAGACQTMVLSRRDGFGNNAPTGAATPVTLGFPPSTTWFVYSSNDCTTGVGAPITMNSTHTVTFSVSPRTSGTQQVTASITGGQMAGANFRVGAAAPSLVFEPPTTGAAFQTVDGCTLVKVARKDIYGNDVPIGGSGGNLTFTLPAGTTAHSGTPCTTGPGNTISAIALNATDARASFYVRATLSSPTGGSVVQTVTASLASQSVNFALTVSPGLPTLGFVTPVAGLLTVAAYTCVPVTLERRDSFLNLVPVGTLPANLTVTPLVAPPTTGLNLFTSNDCTGAPVLSVPVTPLASSSAFSVRRALAGSTNYSITLESQTVQLGLTVNPGPTSKLLVEGLPATITARFCSPLLNVRRQDAFNNNVTAEANLTVLLSSPRFTFSSSSSCTSPTSGATASIINGSSSSAEFIYATGSVAGLTTVVADTSPASLVTGSAPSTILAGAASKLVFLDNAGTLAAGACSPPLRVELEDVDGNPVTPASNFNVTLAGSSTPAPVFSPNGICSGTGVLQLTAAQRVGTFSFKPTLAPVTETITASGSLVSSVSQNWSVVPAGPSKMVWKTVPVPVSTAARFTCVSAGVIQIQDSSGNVTTNPGAVITITPSPVSPSASGMTFFSDSACTTAISTLTVNNGQSETAEFFMLATGASPVNLSASSVLALTAPPSRPITLTGTGSLVITPVDPQLEAGACIAIAVERRDATATPFTKGTTSVNLSVPTASPSIVTLHLLADCSDAPAILPLNRVIAHGMSTIPAVYARGRSALNAGPSPIDSPFTAVDALGGAVASSAGLTTLKVLPLVRRGTCGIANGQFGNRCTVQPPIPGNVITRSFLVFSSTGSVATAADEDVECHLEVVAGVDVVCSRIGNAQVINVNYQVVSFGRDAASGFGVTVQRNTIAALAATTTQPITSVDTGKSFILTSNTMTGNNNDGDAFPVVRFTSFGASVGSVEVLGNTLVAARTVSFEVVTLGFTGASVSHHTDTAPVQTSGGYTIATSSTPTASTFALAMAQVATDTTSANYMCKRRFNVKVASLNTVTLHRGGTAPTANCTTDAVGPSYVQRINIPTAVVKAPTGADFAANNNATVTTALFTAWPIHKSITLLMMQGPGGQTAGEGTFESNANTGDDTGGFHAALSLSAAGDSVSVTRTPPGSNASSFFSPIVVQFDP